MGAGESNVDDSSPSSKQEPPSSWGDIFTVDVDTWKCGTCMVKNKSNNSICAACEAARPSDEVNNVSSGIGQDGIATGAVGAPTSNMQGGAPSDTSTDGAGSGIGKGSVVCGGSVSTAPSKPGAWADTTGSGIGKGGFVFGSGGVASNKPDVWTDASRSVIGKGGFVFGGAAATASSKQNGAILEDEKTIQFDGSGAYDVSDALAASAKASSGGDTGTRGGLLGAAPKDTSNEDGVVELKDSDPRAATDEARVQPEEEAIPLGEANVADAVSTFFWELRNCPFSRNCV